MENRQAQKQYVIGLFEKEDNALAAIRDINASEWDIDNVYSPIPSQKIMTALRLKKSRVGYFTLAGGILGFFSGLGLAIYSASQWHLIVQGKPIISLVPFFIVGFELTILFSVVANFIGILFFTGLPKFKLPTHFYPDCTGEQYGVVATCDTGEHIELMELFTRNGGEARIF